MEFIELMETVGLPGAALFMVVAGGRVLWTFFTGTIYPDMRERQRCEDERRDRLAERDADQATWLVENLSGVSANLQRVADRMDRLERACAEKLMQ